MMTNQWFDAALKGMLERDGDVPDFLFVSGKFPVAQRHASLEEFQIGETGKPLTERDIQEISGIIIRGNKRLMEDFNTRGSCDCSYDLSAMARFRVNVFKQNGRYAIAMRKLPVEIPSIEGLGLPEIFKDMVREKNGVIFLTGATGSGKTTTLAALINEINKTQELHIVTLEDPIEFVHPHIKSVISQRELGKDFPHFAEGLRAALRQAPKVILVGEIRDRETMEIALSASETGHLVLATLHTIDAGQTVNRILGMFSKEEEQQVRQRLADVLRYVVSQRLVTNVNGGRLLVTEIMGTSMRVQEALIYGEAEHRTFPEIIEAGDIKGWHTFDQELVKAFEGGLISEDTTMIFASNKTKIKQDIDMVKKLRSPDLTELMSGLKLEESPLANLQRGIMPPAPSESTMD